MAQKMRLDLHVPRDKTIERLRSHQVGRSVLAHVGPAFEMHGGAQGLFDSILQGMLDTLAEHLAPSDRVEANRTAVVTVNQPTVEAASVTKADGTHLIRVSDAQISLLGLLRDLTLLWAREQSRFRLLSLGRRMWAAHRGTLAETSDMILAGAASIRYNILSQRIEGSSSQVGVPIRLSDSARVDDGVPALLALTFFVAHELGHIVLGHTRRAHDATSAVRRDLEFEADAFGFDLVVRSLGGPKAATLVAQSAVIGLSAITIGADSLFIRSPETHPSTADRVARIAARSGVDATALAALGHGTSAMVRLGADMREPLDPRCWDMLFSSPAFDTTLNAPATYKLVRGYDTWLDADPSRTKGFLRTMQQDRDTPMDDDLALVDFDALIRGVEYFESDGPRAALRCWGVRRFERLVDTKRSLSFHGLMTAVIDSSAFIDLPPDQAELPGRVESNLFLRQTIAMTLTSTIANSLRRAEP
ncbi:phage exclusion protein Lit family protein [Nocardia thailandica]|uniref:phage exclusion protein Lit family protein n=1 Tax=Nocardia thailandica TaxID=257275 RepID=UPI0012F80DA9|nr:phage exclusion protein Lit family protein [Nocardia thailandica]